VQRVLWGEAFEDVWLASRLRASRVAFEVLCGTWPVYSWPRRARRSGGSGCRDSAPRLMSLLHRLPPLRMKRTTMIDTQPLSPGRSRKKLIIDRGYTIKELAALRTYVQRLAPAVIARTCYGTGKDPHADCSRR
jgi:hypothetical protein